MDSQEPLISILMPVRNAIPYLPECLESISQQTNSNWELISVDDHSTDDSYHVLQEHAKMDERISVYKNEVQGIIPALRLAYAQSTGTLITRMDADDRMKPQKLEYLTQNLEQYGPGHLSVGLVQYISSHQLGDGYRRYQNWLNELTKSGENFKDLYRECVIPSPCWMVYRSDLEKSGAFVKNLYPEDYDLCFRFYQSNLKCISSSEIIHEWRDHPNRASRNDPHYADHTFLKLKVHWFLQLHYQENRTLVIWGAGKKGKRIARLLTDKSVPFEWICNNQMKIGKYIGGIKMQSTDDLEQMEDPQVIVAVANPEEQNKIVKSLDQKHLIKMSDYFLFC